MKGELKLNDIKTILSLQSLKTTIQNDKIQTNITKTER